MADDIKIIGWGKPRVANDTTTDRRPWCAICKGTGIFRPIGSKMYQKCTCGRLPNSSAVTKLNKQKALQERFKKLKEEGW